MLSNLEKTQLYTSDFEAQVSTVDSLAIIEKTYTLADSPNFIERTQFVDTHTYLPDDLLVKVDIATMIHSLEGRSPFLDHKLAEFAARLPVGYKLRGRVAKYILKRALRNHLPETVLNRAKQGFGVPVGRWFRHELRQVMYDVLLDQQALSRGFFDRVAVHTLLDDHVSGRANHGQHIWALLMLELWFRSYIDRPQTSLIKPAEGIL